MIKLVNAKHTDAAGTAIADQLLRLLFTPLEGGLRISGAQICQNTMVGVANQQVIGSGAAQVRNFKISCLDAFCMELSGALLTLAMPLTVECAGLSTVGLEFCVVVACQLHPLGDSRITVAEHPHIELHVTVKDVLNPSILYIELQADVGNLVILR